MKLLQKIRKTDGVVEDREKLLRWFDRLLDKLPNGDHLIEFSPTDRTDAQNKYMWVVLGIIARNFGCSADDLHEHFKQEYLPSHEYFILTKQKKLSSTKEQSIDEMSLYLEKIIQFAAEQGIIIPDIEEYKHQQNIF